MFCWKEQLTEKLWGFDRNFFENKWSDPDNVKENNWQYFFIFFLPMIKNMSLKQKSESLENKYVPRWA